MLEFIIIVSLAAIFGGGYCIVEDTREQNRSINV